MNAVIETRASTATVVEVQTTRGSLPFDSTNSGTETVPARLALRQARQSWSSSLGHADLQCLLRVIEGDLIPQLLDSYSPARHAPDERLASQ